MEIVVIGGTGRLDARGLGPVDGVPMTHAALS